MKIKSKKKNPKRPGSKSGILRDEQQTIIEGRNGGPPPTGKTETKGATPMGDVVPLGVEQSFSLQLSASSPDSSVDMTLKAYFAEVTVASGSYTLANTSSLPVTDFFVSEAGYYNGNQTVTLTAGDWVTLYYELDAVAFEDNFQGSTLMVILGRSVVNGNVYQAAMVFEVYSPFGDALGKKKKKPKPATRKKTK